MLHTTYVIFWGFINNCQILLVKEIRGEKKRKCEQSSKNNLAFLAVGCKWFYFSSKFNV